ncbi:MAG: DUF5786 family protein [Candidatus Nanohaloarchaea archaeon]
MGFGTYDESEHEKREKGKDIEDAEYSEQGGRYEGEVEFEDGTVREQLETWQEVKQSMED